MIYLKVIDGKVMAYSYPVDGYEATCSEEDWNGTIFPYVKKVELVSGRLALMIDEVERQEYEEAAVL